MAKEPRKKLSGKEAYPLIDRWMNPKTGHILDVKPEKYHLCLTHIAERLQINHRLSFYSARKSFVQHGFELGIDALHQKGDAAAPPNH